MLNDVKGIIAEAFSSSLDSISDFRSNLSRFQSQSFFDIKIIKHKKLEKLNFNNIEKVVTESRWKHIVEEKYNASYVDADFFLKMNDNFPEKLKFLENSILILSNTPPQYGSKPEERIVALNNFVSACFSLGNSLVVVWDWDNHHHINISSALALASDVYFPSHFANDFELSVSCEYKARLPLSSHQWNRSFLVQNLNNIMRKDRINDVFGKHVEYGIFKHRSRMLLTLNGQNGNISMVKNIDDYKKKSVLEKLDEWTKYKCHWIVPTLNDVSTRVFDALITGGIVILPFRFKFDDVFSDLDERDCVYYKDNDIFNCNSVVKKALDKFDNGGMDGVLRRFRYALDHHNLDVRFDQIMNFLEENFLSKQRVGASKFKCGDFAGV